MHENSLKYFCMRLNYQGLSISFSKFHIFRGVDSYVVYKLKLKLKYILKVFGYLIYIFNTTPLDKVLGKWTKSISSEYKYTLIQLKWSVFQMK